MYWYSVYKGSQNTKIFADNPQNLKINKTFLPQNI